MSCYHSHMSGEMVESVPSVCLGLRDLVTSCFHVTYWHENSMDAIHLTAGSKKLLGPTLLTNKRGMGLLDGCGVDCERCMWLMTFSFPQPEQMFERQNWF